MPGGFPGMYGAAPGYGPMSGQAAVPPMGAPHPATAETPAPTFVPPTPPMLPETDKKAAVQGSFHTTNRTSYYQAGTTYPVPQAQPVYNTPVYYYPTYNPWYNNYYQPPMYWQGW
jgi:hypothetical protein